jgi:bacterioferritin-associated ferredoxin
LTRSSRFFAGSFLWSAQITAPVSGSTFSSALQQGQVTSSASGMKRLSARGAGPASPDGRAEPVEIEIQFHYHPLVMACVLHPGAEPAPDRAAAAPPPAFPWAVPRAMTRCECADVTFQEIARQMAASNGSLDEAVRRTGCGQTCTACLPDLRRYLSSL